MADTDVLVSELDSASAINTNDLLLMTQPDGEAQTGYSSRKGTVLQAATKMLKGIEFATDLPHFDNKTVLGGLEELSTGKANTSGEYNELISGQANALKPSARLENETPYLFRPSFSNGYGYETLIGGTCGFNQLVDLTSATSVGNFNIVSSYEMNCKIDITSTQYPALPSVTFTEGHKYYIVVENGTSANVRFYYDTSYTKYNDTGANTKSERVVYVNGFTASVPFLTLNSGALTGETIKLNVIDLTQMFDTTIADYVYSLESGTAGAGIAWLKANGFFGADYYPYNSGALLSVKTSKKINRDADNNIIGEYPLDDIELHGILKLDADNNLYYDGDTYESSGDVTRKYGIIDLGELTYSLLSNTSTRQAWSTSGLVGLIKPPTSGDDVYNAFSSEFKAVSYNATWLPMTFSSLTATSDQVVFCVEPNAYVDGNAMKTAMSGKYLVYELATPTTETADPFTNPQLVDGNGTEQFVDGRTVEMPVGHETIYVDDNDATKLESLPDISNDGNGTYLVNQINGQLSLAKYGIPNPPTTDGSYRLEVTVTDGVPAYTWEVIS